MILVALITGVAAGVVAMGAFSSSGSLVSPGQLSTALQSGKWTIYQPVPEGTTSTDIAGLRTVSTEQLTVSGPDGAAVSLSCEYCAGEAQAAPIDLTLNNAIASFTVNFAGNYEIKSTGPAGAKIVMASPEAQLADAMPTLFGLGLIASTLVGLGLYLVVSGGARVPTVGVPVGPVEPALELPAATSAVVGAGSPAGWYPNPYRPDTDSQMWWDGKQWTSNWR